MVADKIHGTVIIQNGGDIKELINTFGESSSDSTLASEIMSHNQGHRESLIFVKGTV